MQNINTAKNHVNNKTISKKKSYLNKKLSFDTTPKKLKVFRLLSMFCMGMFALISIVIYLKINSTVNVIDKQRVSQVISAEQIYAKLSDANTNVVNSYLSNEVDGSKFWQRYREEMDQVYNELITVSKNTAFGDSEREKIFTILNSI
ncbi:unnamed protein product, partial [marine sediment metagenome]